MDGSELSWFLQLFGVASAVYGSLCTSIFGAAQPNFHDSDVKDRNVQRQRQGEIVGSVVTVGFGYAMSRTAGNPYPLYAAIFIALAFVGGYEYMIAHPVKECQA